LLAAYSALHSAKVFASADALGSASKRPTTHAVEHRIIEGGMKQPRSASGPWRSYSATSIGTRVVCKEGIRARHTPTPYCEFAQASLAVRTIGAE
jgi:hypothetical protein